MGGAFVGLADDWTAGYWNPAGFAFQSGWSLGQSTDLLSLRAMDNRGLSNPVVPLTHTDIEQGSPFFQLGGEPTHFSVTDATIQAALPSLAAYKCWESWSISAGVFSPLGYAYNIQDSQTPGFDVHYENQGYVLNYNISIARRLGTRWAIGVGANWLDAQLRWKATKITETYRYDAAADGRGQGLQGVFGFLGKPFRWLSLGLTYKTATDLSLKGTASTSNSQFPLSIPGIGVIQNESTGQTSLFHNPATYSAGVALFPVSGLTLTADWEGTDWRPTRTQTTFDEPGVLLQNQDFNDGWRFTNRARAGGEYRWGSAPARQTSVHWGFTWDPYAVPDSAVSMTNIVDVNREVYTMGVSWTRGAWQPNLGWAYARGSRTIDGGEFKKVDRLLSVGLEYRI